MQITLFEIIAGIINFFVLLFILNKLFYKPVREVMEKRQQNIEENIRSAERKNSEAEELIKTYEKKLSEFETEKTEKMIETKKEAEIYRKNLIKKYEEEALGKREAFLSEVREDKDAMASEIRALMAKGTVEIARSMLDQMRGRELDDHLFEALITKIGSFAEEYREKAGREDGRRLVFVYANKPDEEKKTRLERMLRESGMSAEGLDFREDPSLVAGYELQMQDYTIHSSLSHYLDKKEEQMSDYFEEAVRDRSDEYDTQK